MKIADVCIRRPVFAIMMSVALVVLGLFSYKDLGVDLMPRTDQPNVSVSVRLQGASPEEMESQITKPIEEAVNSIDGIDELRCVEILTRDYESLRKRPERAPHTSQRSGPSRTA